MWISRRNVKHLREDIEFLDKRVKELDKRMNLTKHTRSDSIDRSNALDILVSELAARAGVELKWSRPAKGGWSVVDKEAEED